MGPQLQYLETVLTCEGNFYAPDFCHHLDHLKIKLQQLIAKDASKLELKKVEPWNSVRVTFNMPVEAARRLKELAERRDSILRDLGILAIQIEGDRVISLTLESKSSDHAEVNVDLPTQSSVANSNGLDLLGVDETRHDNQRLLGTSDIVHAVTNIAMQEGFGISSSARMRPLCDGNLKTPPTVVDTVNTPLSRSVDFGSSQIQNMSSSFGQNGAPQSGTDILLAQHIAINQLSYELQSFQHQFEQQQQQQQSLFNNDISSQINNGFIVPACGQIRTSTDVAASLGLLHQTQSASGRVWPRVEDRMPISQNIASSSPLLVNLLKSPGGRHPPPNLMIPPRVLPPEIYLPGNLVMPPQKRKRSQQRLPKRPKLELASNEVPGSLAVSGAASSTSMVTQFGFLKGTCATESLVPSASSSSGLPGLAHNNPFTMSAAGCSDAQSRHRFMINPYTGDLEEVDDADEVEAHFWDVVRPSTEMKSGSWMSVGQSNMTCSGTSSPLLSSMHLPLGLETSAHNLNMTKLASMTSAHNSFAGLQGGLETNLQQMSSRVPSVLIPSALNIPPPVPDASRSSLHLNPAVTSSLSFSLLYSSPSLITSSKPQTISPVLAYSETHGLVPPQVIDRSSASLHANLLSSTFHQLSSSHTSLPFSSGPFQSKPANFPATCSGQNTVDALPPPTVSSHLSNYAITSSFHHFYAMAMPASVCSVQGQPSGSAHSVIPSSIPLSEAKTTLEIKSVCDSAPYLATGVEALHELGRHTPLDAANALVLGKLQLPTPTSVVGSPILSKLPDVTSHGCLSLENTTGVAMNQIFSLERLPIVDMSKPTVSETVVKNTMNVLSLETPVASSVHITDVPECQSATPGSAVEPVNKTVCDAVLHKAKSESVIDQKREVNNTHDSGSSIAFPVAVLPCSSYQQELFSLSVALSQNGRIPIVSCSYSERGKPDNMASVSDIQDGEASVASGNCIQTITSETEKVEVSSSTKTSTIEETAFITGEAEVSLHSSIVDLVLPPDKVISTHVSSSNSTVSRTSCVSDFLVPSSFPLVLASSGIDTRTLQINQAAALLQVRLHDSLHSHDHMASSKLAAIPRGSFTPLGFPRGMDSAMHRTSNDILPINVLGKTIFATRPVFMTTTTPSAGVRPNFSQHQLVSDAIASLQSSSDSLKSGVISLPVNPLQPVFHGPLDKLHLARESNFLLPLAGGLKSIMSGVPGTESEHPAGPLQTEVVSTQGSFEKLGCYLSAKPTMNLQGCVETEDESGTQKIKFDASKATAEGFGFCGDSGVQSIRDSNGTSAIGLQEIIAMLTPADEHQAAKVVPSALAASQLEQSGTVNSIVASEVRTLEVCEGVTVADAIRVPPPISSSFSNAAVRFTMFPETKLMTREPSHRKSSRSADDSSPRSKATLTVAKLLEKAESAKMSMQPVSKATESMVSLEAAGFRQSSGLSSFSDSTFIMASSPSEMSVKAVPTSPAATRTNFANISTNCLASKVSISLPTSLSHGFSMMDSNPLPITAPGYPLNLTESVQKVMQGVGLDTSPPPSPKMPPTSSRLSPAKFSGLPITAVQSRSLASHSNLLLGSTTSEIKSKDSTPPKTSRASSNSSIPDSCGDSVLPADGPSSGGSGQKSESGVTLVVDSQIIPEENLPASAAETGKGLAQSCSVPFPTDKEISEKAETSGKGDVTKIASCDQLMNASLVCVVDHSYSALPDPNASKSVRETEENLHDSFEDLPENLNPIDDCHDIEEMFDEITETQVSHFGDKYLFVDGLIYSEGMETFSVMQDVIEDSGAVQEPVIEEIQDIFLDQVEAVRALERSEVDTVDTIAEEENIEKDVKENLAEVPEKQESDKLMCSVPPPVTSDTESSDLVNEKSEKHFELKTEEQNDVMESKLDEFLPKLDSGVVQIQSSLDSFMEPVTTLFTATVDFCEEVTTHIMQPEMEDGTFVVAMTSDHNRFESLTKSTEPIRRTRLRKGQRSRERRGGRFIPKDARLADDGKQEFSSGAGSQDVAYTSPRDNFACKVSGNMIAAELTVADGTDKPCVPTDSPVTSLQASGRMTTRSRGRKNPRAVENPILPPAGDSSETAEGWLTLSDLSPVASKLCENSQRLENPILLRRSTRTLRKTEMVHSSAGNCDDNLKVLTTPRSRKRQAKDIRTIEHRSARGGNRSTVVEILDDFEEIMDTFSVIPITENSQGEKLPSEEGLSVRENKESAAKKSKT